MAEGNGCDPYEGDEKKNNKEFEWKGLIFYILIITLWPLTYLFWGRKKADSLLDGLKFKVKSLFCWGYTIKSFLLYFFNGPIEAPQKDVDFLQRMEFILEPSNSELSVIQKCKELMRLHRINENTKARKRLEKWVSRLIAIYLVIVLALVLGNSISIDYSGCLSFMNKIKMSIPPSVMITILSTTTVNIIGLGLIILRGHFETKDDLQGLNSKADGEKESVRNSENSRSTMSTSSSSNSSANQNGEEVPEDLDSLIDVDGSESLDAQSERAKEPISER